MQMWEPSISPWSVDKPYHWKGGFQQCPLALTTLSMLLCPMQMEVPFTAAQTLLMMLRLIEYEGPLNEKSVAKGNNCLDNLSIACKQHELPIHPTAIVCFTSSDSSCNRITTDSKVSINGDLIHAEMMCS
ncbi:hypothetical protein DIPPA_02986 [Diplonema papillatum]|nr:hypothetical protein DIPPA_02986 [Diplonema papillatum]